MQTSSYVIPSGYIAEIHFDGSYTQCENGLTDAAGFGIAIALPHNNTITQYCSPVVLDRRLATYRGANKLSNNVAELSGAVHALELAATLPTGKVRIGYDSEFAKCSATGEWKARSAARLAASVRRALAHLTTTHTVEWVHVDSHTGHFLNEMVDALASQGANGAYLWPPNNPQGTSTSTSASAAAPASATD